MKKIYYFLILFPLFFSFCSKDDNKIKFTFLQLNDVYEISGVGSKYGGFDRVETLHKQLLMENPNTLMFMAGDFLNPSLLSTIKVDGERIKGKHIVEVMNAMDFDLVAFGNHEFDLKEHLLQKRLNESTFQWVSTNTMHAIGEERNQIEAFFIEKDSVKTDIPRTFTFSLKDDDGTEIQIGFISPCINSNPKDYVDYGDLYEDSKNAFNVLKPKVDIVFGLTHLDLAMDKMIAEMLPEIPLLMGGHEHVNNYIKVNNTYIAKADANAKTVYVHRIEYDTKTKEITIKSELVEINDKFEKDEKVTKIINKWNVFLDDKLKEILPEPSKVIYHTKEPLDGRDTPSRSKQTNLGQIITKAMSYSFDDKVDCALVNGGSIRIDDELHGDITGVDIFRVLPFGGEVLKIKLKGILLEKTLNYGRLKAGKGAYLQRYKADYDKKTKMWFIDGNKLKPNKIYTVAVSDYLMRGLDIPVLNRENKDVKKVFKNKPEDLASDIRKAIITYLENLE